MRSFGVLSRQVSHAFSAARTARSTSSSPPFGTSAITSPVAGFRTSIVSPERASTNAPSTNIFCWLTATLIEFLRDSKTTATLARSHGAFVARDGSSLT